MIISCYLLQCQASEIPFNYGVKGCKILVKVASTRQPSRIGQLEHLQQHGRQLFAKYEFKEESLENSPEFMKIIE